LIKLKKNVNGPERKAPSSDHDNTRWSYPDRDREIHTIELPSQFLDKADIFSETVNNRLANASSQVNRLKKMSSLLGDLPDSATEDDISQHLMAVLSQIKESEQATMKAFQALLKAGKQS